MPSSPNYVRDYKQERKTSLARGERKGNILRKRARRRAESLGLVKPHDGKDVDHKKALSHGGSNAPSNQRVVSASTNRGFPRNSDGSMKKGGNN